MPTRHFFLSKVEESELDGVFVCFVKQNECVGEEVMGVFLMPGCKLRRAGELGEFCVDVHAKVRAVSGL